MEKQIDICSTCRFGVKNYTSVIGTIPWCCEKHWQDMGYRLPVFDIQIKAQRRNAYSTVAQNELALQLYSQGLFNPQMTQQALMCLDMMEFEGKDEVKRKVAEAGLRYQMQVQMQMQIMAAQAGQPAQSGQGEKGTQDPDLENSGENSRVSNARARAREAATGA